MEGGFAVDGQFDGKPWQLEWAPPQRPFMQGSELRMQIQAGIAHDVHMMVLSRPLMESLEKQAFQKFTQSLQTQIDDASPEEMRWLVMFAKVDLAGIAGGGGALRRGGEFAGAGPAVARGATGQAARACHRHACWWATRRS